MMDGATRKRLMSVGEFLDRHPDGEKWELIGDICTRTAGSGPTCPLPNFSNGCPE